MTAVYVVTAGSGDSYPSNAPYLDADQAYGFAEDYNGIALVDPVQATDGIKWVWRLDISVRVRHHRSMDRRDLEQLGHHVVSRRVALGFRNRTDLANRLAFTVRTLSDIEQGVRKASPGTYAMLENKLAWAPGSIDTILVGGEPKKPWSNCAAPTQTVCPTQPPTRCGAPQPRSCC